MRRSPTRSGAVGPAPRTPEEAAAELERAVDREAVFGALLCAARGRVGFAAILSVHKDRIQGRRAMAEDRFPLASFDLLVAPRATVPGFEEAIASRYPYVGPIATGRPPVDAILQRLGGIVPAAAMALPIAVGERTALLLVGHRGEAPLGRDEIAELFPLLAIAGEALARMIASRGDAAAHQPGRRSPTAAIEPADDNVGAQRRLLEVHRQYESWEELADALRWLVRTGVEQGEPDEEEQLELLLELGAVEADRLGRPDLAIDAWRSALAIDAGDRRVLDRLEQILATQDRWTEVVELLERRAALADDAEGRIAPLLNVAALARDRLDDEARAIEAYERILAWEPGHPAAALELEALYRVHRRWEPLATLLVDLASRDDDPQRAVAALESAAEIFEDQLGDRRSAFLVRVAVLRREPDRGEGSAALDRLGPLADAWTELVPECAALAEELEPGHPAAAARLWRQVAGWRRDALGDGEAAAAALERALRLEPDEIDDLALLIELRRAVGPRAALAAALARRAALELDPSRRAALQRELADLAEAEGDPAGAIASLDHAVAAEPGDRAALDGLRRLHRQRRGWDALAATLGQLLEIVATGPERVELLLELGGLLADELRRPDEAIRALDAALALEPTRAEAFEALKRIHQAGGDRDRYLAILEAELDARPSLDVAYRYGELALEWQARPAGHERAIACWRKLVGLDGANLAGHQGLARALAEAGQWDALAVAHRVHLAAVPTAAERAAILATLADLLERRLDDVGGAIDAIREVLELAVDHGAALGALGRLYERAGRWGEAIASLERLRKATAEPQPRAEVEQRIGRIHAAQGDLAAARACFEQALALDLRNAGAHEGIAGIRRAQGEPAEAAEGMVRAAQLSAGPAEAIARLCQAAEIYRAEVRDPEGERGCYERILELDPGDRPARRALCDLLAAAGLGSALWPHLAALAAQLRDDPDASPPDRLEAYVRAARCAVEIGEPTRAHELYDLALAEAPGDRTISLARADALARAGDVRAADAAYAALLAGPGDALGDRERAEVQRGVARIHRELGRHPEAALAYREALALEPGHADTLTALAELELAGGRAEAAIGVLGDLAAALAGPDRAAVLERIADLHRVPLADLERAASSYLEALADDAANHRILQKLLDVQSEAGRWRDALATIQRFLELEQEPARRGRYHLAAASILQTELDDVDGALASYEQALDAFLARPDALEPATRTRALQAFEAIDQILTARRDWPGEERAYRAMLRRLPPSDPVAVTLWDALGEIHRTRLSRYDAAIEAFETAHALDPAGRPDRVAILAELYALVGRDAAGGLGDRALRLVDADPDNPEAVRVLCRAFLDEGKLDEAWCVARALVAMEQAGPAEAELYARHRAHERRKAKGVLDEDRWALLRDAEEDRVISAIFALTWEGPVSLRAGPPKSFELRERDKLAVEDGSRVMSKIFQTSARVLNAPLPHVYVQAERTGRLFLASCVEDKRLTPAVIVGRDLMAGYRDTEVAFCVASMIALLRPTYYFRLALSGLAELEAALLAAAALGGRELAGAPELAPLVRSFGTEIERRLTPAGRVALAELVARLPERPDLARWRDAVDRAARRAGLLICGELAAATRMVVSEPASSTGPRPADKVRDLTRFSISRGYFAARRHLGLRITA